jgi:hypothetical protein
MPRQWLLLPLTDCLHSFLVTLQQVSACMCSCQLLLLVMIHALLLLLIFGSPLSAILKQLVLW